MVELDKNAFNIAPMVLVLFENIYALCNYFPKTIFTSNFPKLSPSIEKTSLYTPTDIYVEERQFH